MNLGWIFIFLFLSIKKDGISRHVFHMFVGCEFTAKNGWILRHVFHMFAGCEFRAKNGWILRHVFHMFAGCEFLTKNERILRHVFHMFMRVWISDKEWMNFKACFSYVYEGVNVCVLCVFWWILKYVFHMFMGCEFLTKNGWISRCFSYVYRGVNFRQWRKRKKSPSKKKKVTKVTFVTLHILMIYLVNFMNISQFHELNGWKTRSHSVCLEFDGINSKNVTFIWFNLHAWGLIMSYYGLKWKQI